MFKSNRIEDFPTFTEQMFVAYDEMNDTKINLKELNG